VPLHLTAFHPAGAMGGHPATDPARLARARAVARAEGLVHVYTGNLHDPEGASTWCPGCGRRLIGRDRVALTDWGLGPDGRCPGCGHALAGRFEPSPGRWGGRRQPVRLDRLDDGAPR
jgi:pyruvate formate lyase activating enzyme